MTVASDHPLGDVLLLKQPDADTVVDRFLGRATPAPAAAAPANTQVTVLNALGTSRPGRHHRHQAPHLGYQIATVGNAPPPTSPGRRSATPPAAWPTPGTCQHSSAAPA